MVLEGGNMSAARRGCLSSARAEGKVANSGVRSNAWLSSVWAKLESPGLGAAKRSGLEVLGCR